MTFKITRDMDVVVIDYYTPSLVHYSIGIYAEDIPELIKTLKEGGFK